MARTAAMANKIQELFNMLGPVYTVLLITLLAEFSLVALTFISYSLAEITVTATHMLVAAMLGLVIAPVLATPIVHQLFRVSSLEKENRRLATYDQLTGLLTRNAFMGRAEAHIKLASRKRSDFAVAFLDLDGFKFVNDNYGHGVGDDLINALGVALKDVQRDSDLVGRYGGDEFVILLPETSLVGAQSFIGKIQESINKVVIEGVGTKLTITASIGLTIARSANIYLALDEYLKQADEALYKAKGAGKNCVYLYVSEQDKELRSADNNEPGPCYQEFILPNNLVV